MKQKKELFFYLVLTVCLTQIAADIYAPSLPSITEYFATTMKHSQLTMSIFMFAVAIFHLVFGPLSEGYGRKLPINFGILNFIIGSVICSISLNIQTLMVGRFLQGFGAAACASLWRPVFRDLYSGDELSQKTSTLVIFITFLVPASPFLGGLLEEYFGFRASFIFLTIYGFIVLYGMTRKFTETNLHYHRENMRLKTIKKNYFTLLKNPLFMGMSFCVFLTYGSLFSWIVVSPALLINKLNLTPSQYGLFIFLGPGFAFLMTGLLNTRYVIKYGSDKMLLFGFFVMICSSIFIILNQYIFGLTFLGLAIPVIIFLFGAVFIFPNAFGIAFTPFGHIAGYAGALYGFMQMGGAAFHSFILSFIPENTQVPLGVTMLISSLLALAIYQKVKPKKFKETKTI